MTKKFFFLNQRNQLGILRYCFPAGLLKKKNHLVCVRVELTTFALSAPRSAD